MSGPLFKCLKASQYIHGGKLNNIRDLHFFYVFKRKQKYNYQKNKTRTFLGFDSLLFGAWPKFKFDEDNLSCQHDVNPQAPVPVLLVGLRQRHWHSSPRYTSIMHDHVPCSKTMPGGMKVLWGEMNETWNVRGRFVLTGIYRCLCWETDAQSGVILVFSTNVMVP